MRSFANHTPARQHGSVVIVDISSWRVECERVAGPSALKSGTVSGRGTRLVPRPPSEDDLVLSTEGTSLGSYRLTESWVTENQSSVPYPVSPVTPSSLLSVLDWAYSPPDDLLFPPPSAFCQNLSLSLKLIFLSLHTQVPCCLHPPSHLVAIHSDWKQQNRTFGGSARAATSVSLDRGFFGYR